jgi:subtilisin family serine protease
MNIQFKIFTLILVSLSSSMALSDEVILSGNKNDLDFVVSKFKTHSRLEPVFGEVERRYLENESIRTRRYRLSHWANALSFQNQLGKSDQSREWSEEKNRLQDFIRSHQLSIQTETNDAVKQPTPQFETPEKSATFSRRLKSIVNWMGSKLALDDFRFDQWFLFNSNITLRRNAWDTLDLSEYIKGVPGMDIQLNEPSRKGENILVAVLDSGIDLTHPDFQNPAEKDSSIFTKKEECALLEDYRACTKIKPRKLCDRDYLIPANDKDGNGYPLDCHGWSTVEGDKGSPIVDDSISHGTHVSGIIAAKENGYGIDGVAPKSKILPVRVINEDPSGENESTAQKLTGVSVVSQVARGMVYALKNRANVINLSLGWNGRSDSLLMRELVQLADKQGVLVVAAAGNDGTNALVFPCQYSEVICVGAHRNDGKKLDFSNFGNGVDISAPGMNILSTIPENFDPEIFTEKKGYDFKDGTSMSTPLVSGAIARLLSDGVAVSEIKSRLYLGSTPSRDDRTHVLSGLLNIRGALETKLEPFFSPINKGVYPAVLSPDGNLFQIPFSALNIGSNTVESVGLRLEIRDTESVSPAVEILQKEFLIPPVKSGSKFSQNLSFRTLSDRVPSEIELIATLQVDGRSQILQIPILLSTLLTKSSLPSSALELPIQNPENFLKDGILFSIKSLDKSPTQDYFVFKATGDTTLEIQILKEERNTRKEKIYVAQPPKEIQFPRMASPRIIQRLDVNGDGKSEYFASFYSERDDGEAIQSFLVYYWNERIEDVLPSFIFSGKDVPASIFRLDSFQWIQSKGRLVPAWIDLNAPVARDERALAYDVVLNPHPETHFSSRIVYHDPDASEGLRTIPQYFLNGKIPLRFFDQIEPGKTSILFANSLKESRFGYSTASLTQTQKPIIFRFNETDTVPYRDFRVSRDELNFIPLDGSEKIEVAGYQKNIGTPTQTFTLLEKKGMKTTQKELHFKTTFPQDIVFRGMAGFYGKGKIAAFAMGLYSIYYQDESMRSGTNEETPKSLSTSLRRYTFLPSTIFDRQFYAASVEVDDEKLPALRIPHGMGAYPGSEVIIPEKNRKSGISERLYRPAKFRYLVGDDCEEMAPIPANGGDPFLAVYFCGDRFIRIPYRL